MTGSFALVEVAASASHADLPHRCPDGTDVTIPYEIGPRGRERLADGEPLPVTARCRRCDGRVFASLVDPGAGRARRAAARPDPTALREPAALRRPEARRGAVGRGAGEPIDLTSRRRALEARERALEPSGDPCPACGAVPDVFGICRCSL